MKTLNLTVLIAAATLLTACGDDSDEPRGSQVMMSATLYSPTAPEGTLINGTVVSVTAFADPSSSAPERLLDAVALSKTDNRWSYSPVVNWPSTAVDFYAFSPIDHNSPTFTPSSQSTWYDNTATADFIYAAAKNIKKSSGTVNLNFRHALAKVTFKFCAPQGVALYVDGVKLHGLIKESSFTWPAGSTGIGSPVIPGKWNPSTANSTSLVGNVYTIAAPQPEPEPLSATPTDLCTTMCYYFIPQSLNSYSTAGYGAYLSVNIGDGNSFNTVDIPVKTAECGEWEQGKAYEYVITFPSATDAPAVKVTAADY